MSTQEYVHHKFAPVARPFIFYDVDGVLNTFTTPEEDKANGMSQLLSYPHVERLKGIQKAVDGYLVCVSSWRKFDANVAMLKSVGLWQGLHTEYDNPALPTRAHEIQDWLDWQTRGPDTPFIVLDDRQDAYQSDFTKGWYMPLIRSEYGLGEEHIEGALRYFREQSL